VTFSGRERPVVLLTDDGRAVMKGEHPARLLLPPLEGARGRSRRGPPPGVAQPSVGAGAETVLDAAGEALFEALRRERLRLAQQDQLAPFMVASDRTLRDIVRLRPRTVDELRLAHGIGPHKAARYGARWLEVVTHHAAAPAGGARWTRTSRGEPRTNLPSCP
jgi:ATP-dependent DNA helicase RecQ